MEITIRDAELADADSLALLVTQLGYPQDSDFIRRKLKEFAARESARIFVAERNARIVGFLSFDSEPAFHREGRIGTITALCVLEDVRGEGVGHRLVEHAEQFAREAGCARLAVSSGIHRTRTHQFYHGLGYEEKTKRFVKDF